MPDTHDRYLTPMEISKEFKVSRITVARWLRTGKLKGVKVGRLWRVRESDLQAFLKEGGKE